MLQHGVARDRREADAVAQQDGAVAIDTKNRFDRAIIRLPNGEIVEGKVSSWLDYGDSDVVQVTIAGKTYLTHYSNVCLIED